MRRSRLAAWRTMRAVSVRFSRVCTIWEPPLLRQRCKAQTTSAACGSQIANGTPKKPKKPKAPEDETPIGDHPPGDGPTDGNPGYPPRVLEDATVCLRLESKYTGSLGNLTQF